MKPKKFLTQKKIDKLQALIDDNNGVVNQEDILPLLKGFKKQLIIQLVSNRRELLIDFRNWWYGNRRSANAVTNDEIDEFLGN